MLKRNPRVFGASIPLFGTTPYVPRRFTHVSTQPLAAGVIVEEYEAQSAG